MGSTLMSLQRTPLVACEENDKAEAEATADTGRSVWFVAALPAPGGADRFGRGAAHTAPKDGEGASA